MYFDNLENVFLNKFEKKNYRYVLFTYRLTMFQISCNFIIVSIFMQFHYRFKFNAISLSFQIAQNFDGS
jgi:hypothetical protein